MTPRGLGMGAGPQWKGTPGSNRAREVVLMWGDPRLEAAGLGFSSSLPVLPGVGAMIRLAPTPSSPPTPPFAELSPPVGRVYFLGALAPVQGGPGWLQRQEGRGLRPTSLSPLSPADPTPSPQQVQGLLSTGGLVQGVLPDCTLLSYHTPFLLPASLGTSTSGIFPAPRL